jgi:hypothetical protein
MTEDGKRQLLVTFWWRRLATFFKKRIIHVKIHGAKFTVISTPKWTWTNVLNVALRWTKLILKLKMESFLWFCLDDGSSNYSWHPCLGSLIPCILHIGITSILCNMLCLFVKGLLLCLSFWNGILINPGYYQGLWHKKTRCCDKLGLYIYKFLLIF